MATKYRVRELGNPVNQNDRYVLECAKGKKEEWSHCGTFPTLGEAKAYIEAREEIKKIEIASAKRSIVYEVEM